MNKFLLLAAFWSASIGLSAQTTLFYTGDESGFPYRIPAIATAANGDVIALTDRRPCGSDIGFGRVDILMRVSKDNGRTWSKATDVLVGTGQGADAGFGDACLVADRKKNELLLVCVSGDVPYFKSTPAHRQRLMITHARYDKKSATWQWDRPTDLTAQVYDTLLAGRIGGLFMGSGRICQSRQVKVGKYYRLYAALCTHKGNFVVYSDDFGRRWHVLGSNTESCAPEGDEPKCEELPDGNVVLSSRKHGGRFFNVFRFTDKVRALGTWDGVVDSRTVEEGISNEGTPCNGEILILPVKTQAGKKSYLALQSIPAGKGRQNVTIYWKELAVPTDYNNSRNFASCWEGSFQVSTKGSAYSTMTQQKDKRIGFFYEEEPGYYQMVYRPLTVEEITQGAYHAR